MRVHFKFEYRILRPSNRCFITYPSSTGRSRSQASATTTIQCTRLVLCTPGWPKAQATKERPVRHSRSTRIILAQRARAAGRTRCRAEQISEIDSSVRRSVMCLVRFCRLVRSNFRLIQNVKSVVRTRFPI